MSWWITIALAAFAIVGRSMYLMKVRRYRYYANLFWEVDRIADPTRFKRIYRSELVFLSLLAFLVAGYAAWLLMKDNTL
jgi:hypothetical protein